MKTFALSQWSFMRVLRLLTGLVGVFFGLKNQDFLLGMAGGFLLFMAFTNTGCCGVNGCSIPAYPGKSSRPEADTSFEEVNTEDPSAK